MKQCPNCDKIYGDSDYYCLKCRYPLKKVNENTISNDVIENALRHETAINNPSKLTINSTIDKVSCPRCGSSQIQLLRKKWSIFAGLFTTKVDRYCVNCKYKF